MVSIWDHTFPYIFLGLHFSINSATLHYPPLLNQSPKKLQNPGDRRELQLYFYNRYITTFMHLGHLTSIYLYLWIMILISTKIYNPQENRKKWILCDESGLRLYIKGITFSSTSVYWKQSRCRWSCMPLKLILRKSFMRAQKILKTL